MRALRSLGAGLPPVLVLLTAIIGYSVNNGARAQSVAPSVEADEQTPSPAASPAPSPSPPNHNQAIEMVLARLCEAFGSPADGCEQASEPDKLNIRDVARAASTRDVSFVLTTVPDYVDSNTAWMADEILGAVQAALPHDGYAIERFYLPEVPQSVSKTGAGVVRDADPHAGTRDGGRLHESHPGVMIFRNQTRDLKVLLLAQETATSGLHTVAFENAARFIADWYEARCRPAGDDASDCDPPELRIVGPTFSGSVPLMVDSLIELISTQRATAFAAGSKIKTEMKQAPMKPFAAIHVLSGSATRDENGREFARLCKAWGLGEKNCSYASAMHTNSETVAALYSYLRTMNPDWLKGRVGILQESNTAFGLSFDLGGGACKRWLNMDAAAVPNEGKAQYEMCRDDSLVRRYSFPLHIAQLRDDSRSAPSLPSLLTSPAVALRLGESVRPVDLVPPMRPDVASPVTQLSMAATLDDISHRALKAVGIYATDVRDTLYLSRELKRRLPDVQLFYPSAHLLYQHQDFVAYTRGALVASTYPLSAGYQLWGMKGKDDKGKETNPRREVFTSTVAQGVFNATLAQIAVNDDYLPDYPPRGAATRASGDDHIGEPVLGPRPAPWLSVVGDDGFWPLRQHTSGLVAASPGVPRFGDTHWPVIGFIVAILLTIVLALHAWIGVAVLAERVGRQPRLLARATVRQIPLLNVLLTTSAQPDVVWLHRMMIAIAFAVVGCLAFWGLSVTIVHQFGSPELATSVALGVLPWALLASVVISGPPSAGSWTPWRARVATRSSRSIVATRVSGATVAGVLIVPALYAVPLTLLASSVITTYWSGADREAAIFAAARVVGGGIVSPAALIVNLLAAVYVPVFWSMRRLSTTGAGYAPLDCSPAFQRLLGGSPSVARLTALLDGPIRQLPLVYFVGLTIGVVVVAWIISSDGATVDGLAFRWFIITASLLASVTATSLLAQSLEIWRRLRALLEHAADLQLDDAVKRLGTQRLHWSMSMFSPDERDLMPLLRIVDDLREEVRRADLLGDPVAAALALEPKLSSSATANVGPTPLKQSPLWAQLWKLADALTPTLDAERWGCCSPESSRLQRSVAPAKGCLDSAEALVAGLRALALRDITARIMAGVFTAMLGIALMTTGHLLYVFQGRDSFFMLDTAALSVGGAIAVWLLIGMEKDAILSVLWQTKPGRITFNWAFVQRVVIYGLVPLLVLIGSLFPEVGEKLVILIDPLRRLTSL